MVGRFLPLFRDIVPYFHSFLEGFEFSFGFGQMEPYHLLLSFLLGIVRKAHVRLACCCCWCSHCEFSCLLSVFPFVQNDPHSRRSLGRSDWLDALLRVTPIHISNQATCKIMTISFMLAMRNLFMWIQVSKCLKVLSTVSLLFSSVSL